MKGIYRLTSLMLIIAVALWGVSFVATKVCLEYLTPAEVIAARFILALPVLYAVTWRKRRSYRFVKERFPVLAACGLVLAAHLLIQVEGMKTTTATNTAWLITTIPVFIVVLSAVFLRERIGWRQGTGMALAAFGVLVLVSRGKLGSLDFISSYGDWLVLTSCLTWSIYTILGKKLDAAPPLPTTTAILTLAALVIVPAVLIRSGPGVYFDLPARVIYALIFLGVFCLALAYWLWIEALRRKPAGRVGVYLYLEPISTMLVAPYVLGESITTSLLGGGVLVIIGVWLVEGAGLNFSRRRRTV